MEKQVNSRGTTCSETLTIQDLEADYIEKNMSIVSFDISA